MGVQDVIKNSFLRGFQNTDLTIRTVAILLLTAGVLGIYLFLYIVL